MNLNKIPEKLIDEKGLRIDGRKLDKLRPIKLEVGVLNNAEGSAYVEQGRNKLVVGVYGPRETHPKHMIIADSLATLSHYSSDRPISRTSSSSATRR